MPSTVAKRVIAAVGLEQPVRRVHRRVRTALMPAYLKRNALDDIALRSLIMLGLPSDANCIDVGANLGTVLEWIVQACPQGRHVAFEPQPDLASLLDRSHPNVDVRREALSDAAGTARFAVDVADHPRSGLESTVLMPQCSRMIEVATARLDDVLPPAYRPTLLKIDVEGHELRVLRGARRTLRDHSPTVVLEHAIGKFGPDPDHSHEVFDELHLAGLRVFDMDGTELQASSFVDSYLSGSRFNFLARR